MTNSSSLGRVSAPLDIGLDIVLVFRLRHNEWLPRNHPDCFTAKIFVKGFFVDGIPPFPRKQANSGNRCFRFQFPNILIDSQPYKAPSFSLSRSLLFIERWASEQREGGMRQDRF